MKLDETVVTVITTKNELLRLIKECQHVRVPMPADEHFCIRADVPSMVFQIEDPIFDFSMDKVVCKYFATIDSFVSIYPKEESV